MGYFISYGISYGLKVSLRFLVYLPTGYQTCYDAILERKGQPLLGQPTATLGCLCGI